MIPGLTPMIDVQANLAAYMAKPRRVLPPIPNVRNAIELALIPWLFREVAWNFKSGLQEAGVTGNWQHQSACLLVDIFQSIAQEPTNFYHVPDSYNKRVNRCIDLVILPFSERRVTGVFTIKTMLDLLVEDGCLDPIPANSDFEKAYCQLVTIMTATDVDNGLVGNADVWAAANKQARKIICTLRQRENLYNLPVGQTSVCDKGGLDHA